jgi:hypothetical protein
MDNKKVAAADSWKCQTSLMTGKKQPLKARDKELSHAVQHEFLFELLW